ncbi:hypothetical protein [Macrococcoides caseolyticum]|uniref:hypothetical protein n=1 Tax=Macrococcoides caseolyticum TaxID=69966 RepID=UPI001407E063|nr:MULTISPECIES: hypothetical protein [Macrococcus]MDJ1089982.1 hypothetical protein [Macrococcus caseolyticus]
MDKIYIYVGVIIGAITSYLLYGDIENTLVTSFLILILILIFRKIRINREE